MLSPVFEIKIHHIHHIDSRHDVCDQFSLDMLNSACLSIFSIGFLMEYCFVGVTLTSTIDKGSQGDIEIHWNRRLQSTPCDLRFVYYLS